MTVCPTCGHDDDPPVARKIRLTELQIAAMKTIRHGGWAWVENGRYRVALRALHARAPELVESMFDAAGGELFRLTDAGRTRVFTIAPPAQAGEAEGPKPRSGFAAKHEHAVANGDAPTQTSQD